MRMDYIVMRIQHCCCQPHATHKLRHMLVELGLGQWMFRPGRYVQHAVAVAKIVLHMRFMLILRARKNIHTHALPPQFTGQLVYIHVHAAGLLATQSGKRAGMQRKHCNPHGSIIHGLAGVTTCGWLAENAGLRQCKLDAHSTNKKTQSSIRDRRNQRLLCLNRYTNRRATR